MPKKRWSLAYKKGGQTHTKGLVNQVGESVTEVPQANPYFCILWIWCVFVNIVFIFIFLFVVSLVLWYIFVHTCIYSSLWTIWIIGTVNKLHPARKCCASEPSFLVLSRTHIPFSPPPEASRGTCFITCGHGGHSSRLPPCC